MSIRRRAWLSSSQHKFLQGDHRLRLSQHIFLKLSHVIRFDNLPEPGFRKTDRLLTSGIQITY